MLWDGKKMSMLKLGVALHVLTSNRKAEERRPWRTSSVLSLSGGWRAERGWVSSRSDVSYQTRRSLR